jgi:nicotinamidase-related amidase
MIRKTLLLVLAFVVLIVVFLFAYIKLFEKNALKVSVGQSIKSYGHQKSALLVIDIQEYTTGVCSEQAYYTKVSDSLIVKINKAIDKAVADSLPVIYVRSQVTDPLINLINNSMAPGSKGVGFDKRLKVVSDFIIPKQRQDAFSNPALDSMLISNQISSLYFTGLDLAHCVNSTIAAAINRKYTVTVIEDAVVSESDSMKIRLIKEFQLKNIRIINCSDFITNNL